jgi:hypothetical protein
MVKRTVILLSAVVLYASTSLGDITHTGGVSPADPTTC